MIFGEDFGQLASCGEYEVYKSGTTLAQLNAAIASLSDEEYLDSFLVVVTDMANAELVHLPARTEATTRRYNMVNGQSQSNVLYTQYWQSGNVFFIEKTISSGTMGYTKKATNETGANLLTLNSWKLYKRQKGYDVANGGSNVAYAIAPVQNTLSAANKNYAVGEQFLYDGHLYKVTSAITSGAQIVIGTNAVLAGSVTEQMGSIKYLVKYFDDSVTATTRTNVNVDIPISDPTELNGKTIIARIPLFVTVVDSWGSMTGISIAGIGLPTKITAHIFGTSTTRVRAFVEYLYMD